MLAKKDSIPPAAKVKAKVHYQTQKRMWEVLTKVAKNGSEAKMAEPGRERACCPALCVRVWVVGLRSGGAALSAALLYT